MITATPRSLYPRGKRPSTLFTGGWVGPRAGLDGYGKSRPHRGSIPGLLVHSAGSGPRKTCRYVYLPCTSEELQLCRTIFLDVLLIVHLGIILVINQLNAQNLVL